MTGNFPRPDWSTIVRKHPYLPVQGLALKDSTCYCDRQVLQNEPIMCVGVAVMQDTDGKRTVDLTGAEWRCQMCAFK